MTPEEKQKFVKKVSQALGSTSDPFTRTLDDELAPLFAALNAGQLCADGLKNRGYLNSREGIAWDAALAHLQEVVSK